MSPPLIVNLNSPRYDLRTYVGRAYHFFSTTNPLHSLASDSELDAASKLVATYKKNPFELRDEAAINKVWHAQALVTSAFHPDTGEKNFIMGRMSFQVPGNMLITGCMMTFYQSVPAVIFWQFMNQSFNSIVNYTNRNASTPVSPMHLFSAYAAATSASVATALTLNRLVARYFPSKSPSLLARLVPLAAVAAANCVNVPLMRQQELVKGIEVYASDKLQESSASVGRSKEAAREALYQVIPSRILMASPAMVLPPLLMSVLERNPTSLLRRVPVLAAPVTIAATGLCLAVSTPLCCALFPQTSSLSVDRLEPSITSGLDNKLHVVWYNKGL